MVAPGATSRGAGALVELAVAPPELVTCRWTVRTPRAMAPPLLDTRAVTWKVCPRLSALGASRVSERAAGSSTAVTASRDVGCTGVPLLASGPGPAAGERRAPGPITPSAPDPGEGGAK